MKTLIGMMVAVVMIFTGCATTGKLIATSSTTVDHAMQAWAVYVVDGKASKVQEDRVRVAKEKYDAAEDAAVEAYATFSAGGSKSSWTVAQEYLKQSQSSLISLITMFTGKAL